MDINTFLLTRKPFYLDPETLCVKFPVAKFMNTSHAEWFTEYGYPYVHTVRGYYWCDDDDEFIMLYWNDFEIPNINASLFSYLFEYFPNVKWVGLGCYKTKEGEIWKPRFKVTRGKYM